MNSNKKVWVLDGDYWYLSDVGSFNPELHPDVIDAETGEPWFDPILHPDKFNADGALKPESESYAVQWDCDPGLEW